MHSQQLSLKALAAVLFSTSVGAHMMMSSPAPYGKSTLDNSPLAADGSDYPCKQRTGVYDLEGASNVMAVGSTNTLAFIGSAVHGGGSCQVSLTTDLQPTKDSKWMVIKSLEGGCPADVVGNLSPADASAPDPTTFTYTIPQGIAPGDYTIAWSWVNKVGNREFYMNCGPATITAATKKRYAPNAPTSENTKRQATFPDIFVANLAGVSNSCTTTEGIDIVYPDGGADITKNSDGNFGPPVGCAGGDGAAAAASPTASAAAGGAAPTAASSAGAATTASSGVFATGAAPLSSAAPAATETVSPIPAAASSPPAAASSPPASVASAAPAAASSTAPISSGAVVAGAACTPEGAWACAADGASYQRCASGVWSVSMEMAAGTTCTPGTSMTLNENVTSAKRHTFHARRGHHAYARLS
jgi:hypothetical protein